MNNNECVELAVTRQNIVNVTGIVIRILQRISSECTLDELCRPAVDLTVIFENVFYHGLKRRRSKFHFGESSHPWDFVSRTSERFRPGCLEKINLIGPNQNDHSKLRSLIKIALMEYWMHAIFPVFQTEVFKLVKLYHRGALLLSSELNGFIDTISQLESLQFSFSLKQDSECFESVLPIDYTPYLAYELQTHCHLDAAAKEMAPEQPSARELVNSDCLLDSRQGCGVTQSCAEEKLKQKDGELQRCLVELAEYKSFVRDLEDTVMHLQRQLKRQQTRPSSSITQSSLKCDNLTRDTFDSDGAQTQFITSKSSPVFAVDRGIDALTYCTALSETPIASTSGLVSHPRSRYVPPAFALPVEIGNEPELEAEPVRPIVFENTTESNPNPYYGSPAKSHRFEQNISSETLCKLPSMRKISARKRISPLRSKSAVRMSMQTLPEPHEHFVFPETRNDPVALLRNDFHDQIGRTQHVQRRPIYRPLNSTKTVDRSQRLTLPVQTKQIHTGAKVRKPPASVGSEHHSNVSADSRPQITTELLNSDLTGTANSDELQIDAGYTSTDRLHINKDYYQLTSPSEEDFESSCDNLDHGASHLSESTRKASNCQSWTQASCDLTHLTATDSCPVSESCTEVPTRINQEQSLTSLSSHLNERSF